MKSSWIPVAESERRPAVYIRAWRRSPTCIPITPKVTSCCAGSSTDSPRKSLLMHSSSGAELWSIAAAPNMGLEDRFVRIACRTEEENDWLVEILKEMAPVPPEQEPAVTSVRYL